MLVTTPPQDAAQAREKRQANTELAKPAAGGVSRAAPLASSLRGPSGRTARE
jgi:hypothetical protein